MDVSGITHSYLTNSSDKPLIEKDSPRKSTPSDNAAATSSVNGYFDCNICLEFATDPVVTLCGHLYCWPCIYKWLQVEGTSSQQCPVCKAPLSKETLVPLYGRGGLSRKGEQDIPHRPALLRDHAVIASVLEHRVTGTDGQIYNSFQSMQLPQLREYNHHDYSSDSLYENSFVSTPLHTPIFHWTAGSVIGDLITSVLPSVFRNHHELNLYYSSPNLLTLSGNSPRLRRQQMQVANSLHHIWFFLLMCAVLCFIFF